MSSARRRSAAPYRQKVPSAYNTARCESESGCHPTCSTVGAGAGAAPPPPPGGGGGGARGTAQHTQRAPRARARAPASARRAPRARGGDGVSGGGGGAARQEGGGARRRLCDGGRRGAARAGGWRAHRELERVPGFILSSSAIRCCSTPLSRRSVGRSYPRSRAPAAYWPRPSPSKSSATSLASAAAPGGCHGGGSRISATRCSPTSAISVPFALTCTSSTSYGTVSARPRCASLSPSESRCCTTSSSCSVAGLSQKSSETSKLASSSCGCSSRVEEAFAPCARTRRSLPQTYTSHVEAETSSTPRRREPMESIFARGGAAIFARCATSARRATGLRGQRPRAQHVGCSGHA